MLDKLTHDDFASRVGEGFTLTAPDGATLDLTLAEANPMPQAQSSDARRTPFSLIFHGPREPYAPQGTWQLHNAELGDLELFLVPLGPEHDAMRYEAVFT